MVDTKRTNKGFKFAADRGVVVIHGAVGIIKFYRSLVYLYRTFWLFFETTTQEYTFGIQFKKEIVVFDSTNKPRRGEVQSVNPCSPTTIYDVDGLVTSVIREEHKNEITV